jgi:alanyl-tRNA synthetase
VFVALSGDGVLLATSKDSGVNAGAIVKAVAARGGGSPQMGQGSVADAVAAEERIRTELAWPKESI